MDWLAYLFLGHDHVDDRLRPGDVVDGRDAAVFDTKVLEDDLVPGEVG